MAITITGASNSRKMTADSFDTDNTANVSDSFPARDWDNLSFQLIFSGITGTQPAVKLQASNNETNWDDVPGATHTTTAASESKTFQILGSAAEFYRWKVTTASTTGALVIEASVNGRS